MKKSFFVLSILLCFVLVPAVKAQLTVITGSLNTLAGVDATGNWAYTGFEIKWKISEQQNGSWFYEYWLTDLNGGSL
ncbi:MAG: hypothetical protein JSV44_04155, partial [Candidatus Zixiibacteriota bacterium]